MQPTKPLTYALIDLAIIILGAFPAHAADKPYGFHRYMEIEFFTIDGMLAFNSSSVWAG